MMTLTNQMKLTDDGTPSHKYETQKHSQLNQSKTNVRCLLFGEAVTPWIIEHN